ncbi:hypothetical protein B0H34DRAFT_67800 [Crassisporium funariophilum]|nr:hypothetical protein B0H34DRAFT_67800 [Crassisporium funariophilum]
MRTLTSILALACLVFGTGALAQSAPDSFDTIIARHVNDLYLESRGLMTEFEVRAALIARGKANGYCSGKKTEQQNAKACHDTGGFGWRYHGVCYGINQMLLQGKLTKGKCYH